MLARGLGCAGVCKTVVVVVVREVIFWFDEAKGFGQCKAQGNENCKCHNENEPSALGFCSHWQIHFQPDLGPSLVYLWFVSGHRPN